MCSTSNILVLWFFLKEAPPQNLVLASGASIRINTVHLKKFRIIYITIEQVNNAVRKCLTTWFTKLKFSKATDNNRITLPNHYIQMINYDDQDMIIHNSIGVQKMLFNHQTRWHNCHTEYFSCTIPAQQRSICNIHFYCKFCPFGCSDSIGWSLLTQSVSIPNVLVLTVIGNFVISTFLFTSQMHIFTKHFCTSHYFKH